MNFKLFTAVVSFVVLLGMYSCGDNNADQASNEKDSAAAPMTNQADMAKPAENDWVSLFDGKSFNGWHGFNKKGQEVKNWMIEDSALICLGAAKDAHGGDIITD